MGKFKIGEFKRKKIKIQKIKIKNKNSWKIGEEKSKKLVKK